MEANISDNGSANRRSTKTDSIPSDSTGRRKFVRKPFGQQMQKLAYPVEPGYHHHWFNDNGRGRIDQAKEAGYEHVIGRDGNPVKAPVGVAEGGSILIAFLMKIPQEWYEDDMAAQQRAIDEIDRAIHSGAIAGKPGEDGRYIPARGIKMWRK